MPGAWTNAALRHAVLAASVLDDIDLVPSDEGVQIDGARPVYLTWDDIALAIGDAPPGSVVGRIRLTATLKLHAWVAADRRRARAELQRAVRLLALPADHVLHPGDGWVQHRVLGGALDCGVGLECGLGLEFGTEPEAGPVPLPLGIAEAAGLDDAALFATAQQHARSMGQVATTRLHRDTSGSPAVASASDTQLVLRPIGGVDVLSLLALPQVRGFLAEADGCGMRAIAVPNRSRGWYDLARIDPAFVQAAWAATPTIERGVSRALLVTADEVTLATGGDGVIRLALEDPAVEGAAFWRRHLFH